MGETVIKGMFSGCGIFFIVNCDFRFPFTGRSKLTRIHDIRVTFTCVFAPFFPLLWLRDLLGFILAPSWCWRPGRMPSPSWFNTPLSGRFKWQTLNCVDLSYESCHMTVSFGIEREFENEFVPICLLCCLMNVFMSEVRLNLKLYKAQTRQWSARGKKLHVVHILSFQRQTLHNILYPSIWAVGHNRIPGTCGKSKFLN